MVVVARHVLDLHLQWFASILLQSGMAWRGCARACAWRGKDWDRTVSDGSFPKPAAQLPPLIVYGVLALHPQQRAAYC